MVSFEWWRGMSSSGAEVKLAGEHQCTLYVCELPDLTDDQSGFWSLDVPYYDVESDTVRLRPMGMGRSTDLKQAEIDAEAAAVRFCGRQLELVA